MAVENEAVVVFIPVGIVAVDFHDFGDETPARAAFKVHDDIHGIADIGLDGAIRQVHAALQNATREAGKALPGGSSMYGGKTPGVSGVEKLQEIEGLAAAYLAELRGEFLCGWCEVREGHLLAVPYPNSMCEIRRFVYPRDAEIVGRVTGVAMRLAESQP
jgi:hypothetical protein